MYTLQVSSGRTQTIFRDRDRAAAAEKNRRPYTYLHISVLEVARYSPELTERSVRDSNREFLHGRALAGFSYSIVHRLHFPSLSSPSFPRPVLSSSFVLARPNAPCNAQRASKIDAALRE